MPYRFRTILVCLLLVLTAGCTVARTAPKDSFPPVILRQDGSATTPTATPFQPRTPLPPTPTPFQPQTPVPPTATPYLFPTSEPFYSPAQTTGSFWGNYPPPLVPASIAIPPPVGVLPQPEGQFNILLLGSDKRPYQGGFRTDTMILVTINTRDQQIKMTSFPRDLYVYIPGWTMQRLNTAHARGGFSLTAMTFEYNFGVRPDRYIMINFDGFKNVIDSLGGVEVYVSTGISDQREGHGIYSVPAGYVHMDGETALWYVRSRKTSSDVDRLRRSQEVMQGIAQRLISLNAVTRAPEIYNQYRNSVETNLTLDDILKLAPVASSLSSADGISRHVINFTHVTNWVEPYSGAMVLLPNREAIVQLMRQVLSGP